jgi:thioredoxin reductase
MKSSIGEELGCEKDEIGFFKVTKQGKTNIHGVFAAGDIMSMQHSVLGAASNGQIAGSFAVIELVNEDFAK